jgi:hypothetical protein
MLEFVILARLYPVFGIGILEFGIWYLDFGIWNFTPDVAKV